MFCVVNDNICANKWDVVIVRWWVSSPPQAALSSGCVPRIMTHQVCRSLLLYMRTDPFIKIRLLFSTVAAWPDLSAFFWKLFFFKLLSPACVSACMLITGFLSRHRIIDLTSVPAVLSQLSLPALQNGTSARLCFCPATAAHCPLWGHWTLWSLTHKHLIFTIRFTSIWLSFNFSWTPWTQVSARVHSCSSSLAFLFSLFLQYM